MGLYFYGLNTMGWLRVDPLEEEVGLDISRHKGAAYDIKEANVEDVKQLTDVRMSFNDDRSGRGSKQPALDSAAAKELDEIAEREMEA